MVKKEEIENKIRSLTEELVKLDCDIIYEFPFKAYLDCLKRAYPYLEDLAPAISFARRLYSYLHIGPRTIHRFLRIVSSYDSSIICRYNKLGLAFMMKDALDVLPHKSYPDEIIDLYYQWFTRVLNDLDKRSDNYYSLESRSFRDDVGVCSLCKIPVGGAWLVQKSMVGLGTFNLAGPWQLFQYLSFILGKTGGFSPFYGIHTAHRYRHLFRPEEMNLAYLRIAGLMERDPGIRGIYRASWFLDPNLDTVSPNLAFSRTVPQNNGAKLFRRTTLEVDVRNALSMSATRKKLYEEGKYRPASYAYIWPKKVFLNWAKRQKGE